MLASFAHLIVEGYAALEFKRARQLGVSHREAHYCACLSKIKAHIRRQFPLASVGQVTEPENAFAILDCKAAVTMIRFDE